MTHVSFLLVMKEEVQLLKVGRDGGYAGCQNSVRLNNPMWFQSNKHLRISSVRQALYWGWRETSDLVLALAELRPEVGTQTWMHMVVR